MTYLKATLAGLAASFLVVVAILIYESITAANLARKTHPGELVATAGLYGMVLHSTLVQIVIVVVFAVAFYIAWR